MACAECMHGKHWLLPHLDVDSSSRSASPFGSYRVRLGDDVWSAGGGYFRPGREKVTASNAAIRNVTHALVVDLKNPRLITRRLRIRLGICSMPGSSKRRRVTPASAVNPVPGIRAGENYGLEFTAVSGHFAIGVGTLLLAMPFLR